MLFMNLFCGNGNGAQNVSMGPLGTATLFQKTLYSTTLLKKKKLSFSVYIFIGYIIRNVFERRVCRK